MPCRIRRFVTGDAHQSHVFAASVSTRVRLPCVGTEATEGTVSLLSVLPVSLVVELVLSIASNGL